MAYTDIIAANLISEVRELINEPSAVLFSDADLTAFIDFAVNEMSRMGLYGEEIVPQQLSTATQSYAYTSRLPRPEAVIYYGSSASAPGATARTLVKIHPRQMNKNASRTTAGPPMEWWFEDEKIWVSPTPSASENNHYLMVIAHNYQSYDEEVVPDYLQEYPIWYVLSKCMERKRNFNAAQQYKAIFDSFIMFHRLDNFYPKMVDSKDMMKTPDRTRIIQEG